MINLAVNIITHNGLDSFILEAIRSVRDYCNEIVVVDDGSTDDTRFVIRTEFPDIKILRRENSHTDQRAMLLNDAKFETRAEWILRIDDDEIFPEETMEEIIQLDGLVPIYSIPFLHYEDGGFIDPKAHKKNSFYVARLFKNIPDISWIKKEEVLSYRGRPVSSRGNQPLLCRKIKNPFLHFGELRKYRSKDNYYFHKPNHCKLSLGCYGQYLPKDN